MANNLINIIFIGGTGRSGTNVTHKILSRHKDVASLPFEYRFTIDPFGLIDTYSSIKHSWSPYMVHAKVTELHKLLRTISRRKISRWLIGKVLKWIDPSGKLITPPPYFDWELEKWFPNYLDHVERFIKALVDFQYQGYWPGESAFQLKNKMKFISWNKKYEFIFRDFFVYLITDVLKYSSKSHFVEDNTWNLLYLNEIKEILPEAKFIHVVRDPRDVVVSLKNQRWAPDDLEHCIQYYSSLMDKILHNINENEDTDNYIYQFKLENLIRDRKSIIKNICKFCELDFEDYLLDIDLTRSNIGRWKKELSSQEQIILNKKLAKFIDFLEYK